MRTELVADSNLSITYNEDGTIASFTTAAGVVALAPVGSKRDPLTGGSIFSAANSTLKLPVGELDLSDGLDASSHYVADPQNIAPLISAITMAVAGVRPVRLFTYGDSVGDFVSSYVTADLALSLGKTGYGSGLSHAFSGGAGEALDRYDVSMVSGVNAVPAGGKVIYNAGGGGRKATRAAVWLAVEPGAGTAKVELIAGNANGTAYNSEVLATLSSSVDCAGSLGFVRVDWAGPVTDLASIVITGLTGTVHVIHVFYANDSVSGVQNFIFSQGGITASSAGPVAFAAFYDMISWYGPDAFFYTNRESEEYVRTFNGPLVIQKYRELAPFAAIVVCGVWPVTGENDPTDTSLESYRESAALREYAKLVSGVFIDAYAIFPTYNAIHEIDSTYDGVHIAIPLRKVLVTALYAATGLGAVEGLVSSRDSQNSLTRSQQLSLAREADLDSLTLTSSQDGGGDVIAKLNRWLFIRPADSSHPDVLQLFSKSGDGQYALSNHAAGALANAGNYTSNGQFGITVDGTTGVAKIYARVGGVVKSLTLGTLA